MRSDAEMGRVFTATLVEGKLSSISLAVREPKGLTLLGNGQTCEIDQDQPILPAEARNSGGRLSAVRSSRSGGH